MCGEGAWQAAALLPHAITWLPACARPVLNGCTPAPTRLRLLTSAPRPPVVWPAAAALPNTSVVRDDAAAGALELLAVTPLMRFKDDVAVRVRTLPAAPSADGGEEANGEEADGQAGAAAGQLVVVVDVRSASRLGKGDLGANAARIGKYLEALRAELGQGQKNGSS